MSRAGATIVDERGEIKVKDETNIVAVHLRKRCQLRGLEGSSGPDQVTYLVKFVNGYERRKMSRSASWNPHNVQLFIGLLAGF